MTVSARAIALTRPDGRSNGGPRKIANAIARITFDLATDSGHQMELDPDFSVLGKTRLDELSKSGSTARMCETFAHPFPRMTHLTSLSGCRQRIHRWNGVCEALIATTRFELMTLRGISAHCVSMETRDIVTAARVAVMAGKAASALLAWMSHCPYLHDVDGGYLSAVGTDFMFLLDTTRVDSEFDNHDQIKSVIGDIENIVASGELKSEAAREHIKSVLEWSGRWKQLS
jgi:hypothetical protein